MLNWPQLHNNEKPPTRRDLMLELFMIFSSACSPSRYWGWKWVCWKLAEVRSALSAYRTWRIKVNHSRQLGPPFMVIHPPQLLLRPSPVKKNGETSILWPLQTLSGRHVGQQHHLSPDIDSCLEETAKTLQRWQVDRRNASVKQQEDRGTLMYQLCPPPHSWIKLFGDNGDITAATVGYLYYTSI